MDSPDIFAQEQRDDPQEEVDYGEEPFEENVHQEPAVDEEPASAEENKQAAGATGRRQAVMEKPARKNNGIQEEWDVMEIPENWRPLPIIRVWGIAKHSTEEDLQKVLQDAGCEVRSVAFDSKQQTAKSKVAFVRFNPPPLSWLNTAESKRDVDILKVAEKIVARLKAQPGLELHGERLHFEKTQAEVSLFLSNLKGNMNNDVDLRAHMDTFGTVERCFVLRNPKGDSKAYGFVEFSLPQEATACKDAWQRLADSQRPEKLKDATGEQKFTKVKLQRTEPALIRTVPGLFATVLYVDNLHAHFTDLEALKKIFSNYGEVVHTHMPRNQSNPNVSRGYSFVQFKHSFQADAAFRALDGTEHLGVGKLVVSFSNPVKANESHRGHGSGSSNKGNQSGRNASGTAGNAGRSMSLSAGAMAGRGLAGRNMGALNSAGMMVGAPGMMPSAGGMMGMQAAAAQQAAMMQQRMLMMQQGMMQRQMMMQQMMMKKQLDSAKAALQQTQEQLKAAQAAKEAEEAKRRAEEEAVVAAREKARKEADYSYGYGYGSYGFGGGPKPSVGPAAGMGSSGRTDVGTASGYRASAFGQGVGIPVGGSGASERYGYGASGFGSDRGVVGGYGPGGADRGVGGMFGAGNFAGAAREAAYEERGYAERSAFPSGVGMYGPGGASMRGGLGGSFGGAAGGGVGMQVPRETAYEERGYAERLRSFGGGAADLPGSSYGSRDFGFGGGREGYAGMKRDPEIGYQGGDYSASAYENQYGYPKRPRF